MTMASPAGAGEDLSDLAGTPLDLLLAYAARGSWRRFVPATSSLRFAAGLARRPGAVAGRSGALAAEFARIAVGRCQVAPDARDQRFSDPAWSGNPALRRLLQAYLATAGTAAGLVDDASLPASDRERVRAAVINLIDAAAPSNNPLLNPQALKAAVDSGGANFVHGLRHFVSDMRTPPRVPSMVEADAFEVGATVAVSPGAVVLRTPVLELIQYTPRTPQVRAIPLVIVPPTINKYYVVDLSPGRSLVEYLVDQGHQVFAISWRNPDVRHARWGSNTYGRAILDAMDTARRISAAPSTVVLSLCSGGILTAMVLGHLAAIGELHRVAANAVAVSVLDQQNAGLSGALLTPAMAKAAVRASAARGYLDGRALAEIFVWLRPNDLIWSYWVNNYLLGQPPRPFDVLFWNADTTRMTAALHRDFIDLAQRNVLAIPHGVEMLGTPVDLGRVDLDSYITAGIADHLCPWQNCYRTTQMLGGTSRFVLSTSGHIASIVNPPGNPKAHFRTADHNPGDPDAWLATAETVSGSWWPDFNSWLHARTGDQVPAPAAPGGPDFPVLGPAPGNYVHDS
jgi:polyhydroxyalkanoate synthase